MKRPQAIAITSGKGGVGKTNLSVNLALALQRSTKNVAVFDADLALANAHLVLGCRASRTIVDAISGRCAVQDVLVSGPSGLKLIAGGSGLAELMSLSDDKRQSIISSISSIAPQIDSLIGICGRLCEHQGSASGNGAHAVRHCCEPGDE